MKTKNFFSITYKAALTLVAALFLFSACQDETLENPTEEPESLSEIAVSLTPDEIKTLGLTPSEAAASAITKDELAEMIGEDASNGRWFRNVAIQTVPLIELTNNGFDLADTLGFSKVIRYSGGIIPIIFSTGLEVGTATTLWVAIYNTPDFCTEEICTTPDAFNPANNADILPGGGKIIRSSRLTVFVSHVRVGDLEGSLSPYLIGTPSQGLVNTMSSQIRFILKSHGPALEGDLLNSQLTTFQGGCQFGFLPNVPQLGIEGPNTCSEVQISFFLPAN